jgi:PAS domain S-box-containing protein
MYGSEDVPGGTVRLDAGEGYDGAALGAALGDRTGFTVDGDPPAVCLVFGDDPAFVGRVADRSEVPVVCATADPATVRALARERPAVRVVRWDGGEPWAYLDAALRGAIGESGGERASALVRYEQLMDTIGDAVYALDDEGRFTYVNESLCRMAELSEEELLGSHVGRIKDDATVAEAEDALRDLLRAPPGEQVSLEVDIITDDGERIPCEDRMTLLPYEEEFRGTVGTLRDITEQKRREAMFGGLIGATQRMMGAERPRDIAETVVDTAAQTLGRELVTVRFHEDGELVPVVSSEAATEALPERPVYGIEEGPVGEAYTSGSPLYRRAEDVEDDRDRGKTRGALYLPLGEHGTVTLGTTGEGFDDQDRYFAQLLASIAATALERAERRRELRRYEAVVEAVDDMAFAADERGEFRVVTDPFAEAVGYAREELVGEPVSTVGRGFLETLLDAAAAGESVVRQGELADSEGESFPVRASATPVSRSDFEGVVVSLSDISDLLSAREEATRQRDRFINLFDNLTDPVVEVELDDEPTVVGANDAFRRRCRGEVAGRTVAEAREAFPNDAVADELGRVGGTDLNGTELTVGGEDTRHYALRSVSYTLSGAERAFVVFTDVTRLKRRETHLQVLNRVFRHNLRNDLNVVLGYADELASEGEGETALRAERIREKAERLASLSETAKVIQNVLGAEETEKRPREVGAVFERVAARVRRERPDADLTVEAEEGVCVRADEHLSRAVYELVENAVSHNPAAAPSVTLRGRAEGGGAAITVSDDGPGIPEAEWEVVTSDREITQLDHGSGLGLWLVRWIVESHGGHLELDVGEGGTTVTVRLPR